MGRSTGRYVVGLALAASIACSGRASENATFKDTHPLPEEPMVTRAASVGSYGGRFVVAQTVGPKTFNGPMANEQSSSDVTNLLFVTLADFDNETQQVT